MIGLRLAAVVSVALAVSGCGTSYEVTEVDAASKSKAEALFGEAQKVARPMPNSDRVAAARFKRVVPRVERVGKRLCQQETADRENFDCNVRIGVDTQMTERNAYFTYADVARKRNPVIMVTVPMLRDVQNDDELAFVLAHEYGHLIGRHIEKKEQQALAGMLIMGAIAAGAAANSSYSDSNLVADNMELGFQLGQSAYSQTYELESDTLGTLIARSAGYDPIKGARFFARGESPRGTANQLSFWGTHPADEDRLATVIATVQRIEAEGGIRRASN